MKCYYHPDVDAVATCSNCGKAICQTDAVNVAGKIVCQQCLSTGRATSVATAVPSKPTNTLAIVSIGLGILGLVGCFCWGIFGIIFGALAAITGYMARKQIVASQGAQQGMQLATVGMIMGIAEAVLGLIILLAIIGIYGVGIFAAFLQQLQQR